MASLGSQSSDPRTNGDARKDQMDDNAISFLDFGSSKLDTSGGEVEVDGTWVPSFLPRTQDRDLAEESSNFTSSATLLFANRSSPETVKSTHTGTNSQENSTLTTQPSTMAPAEIDINSLPPHKRTKYKKELAAAKAAEEAEMRNKEDSQPSAQNPAPPLDSVANLEIRQKLEADFNVKVTEPVRGKLVPYSGSSQDSSHDVQHRTFPQADFVLAKRAGDDVRIADQLGFVSPNRDNRRESGTHNAHSEWMRPPMKKGKSSRGGGSSRRAKQDWRANAPPGQEALSMSAFNSTTNDNESTWQQEPASTQAMNGEVASSSRDLVVQPDASGHKNASVKRKQEKLPPAQSWLHKTNEAIRKAVNPRFPKPPPIEPRPVAYDTSPPDSLDNTDRASSGWGTRQKRADEKAWFHAEKNDLRDWDGGIAPPPVDWDNRAGFKDEYSMDKIHEWSVEVSRQLLTVQHDDMMISVKGLTFDVQGEAAPRYWIPSGNHYGFEDKVWLEATTAKHQTIDKDDLLDAKPWWKYYEDRYCSFLKQKWSPIIAGIDPDETETDRLARENDKGGIHVVENKQNAARAKKDAHRARQLKKQERIRQLSQNLTLQVEKPKPIHTTIPRFFIRSAILEDMPAVRDVYNHYVDHAVLVPETTRLETSELELRFRASKDADLPFLIACQRGEVIKARGKRNQRYMDGHDMVLPDKVVGFACADDWNDVRSMCCYTACLELYVHPDFQGKRIGSALLDRVMTLLDPKYFEKGGYETQGEDLDGVGPVRLIKNVIVQYYYDAAKPEKLNWVSKWLENWMEFRKTGDLNGVGRKFDKTVNLAFLQKTTGANLD